MKTISVKEFTSHFSEVIEQVKAGEQIEVTEENSKEVVGYFQKKHTSEPKRKRKLGILEGKASFVFGDDWEMTTEEFLGE